MNTSAALLKLIEAMRMIGIDMERVRIEPIRDDGIQVRIEYLAPAKVIVTIDDFWQYPGIACYFVNFSGDAGNFTACAGTPHIEQALFNLGGVFEQANSYRLEHEQD